MEYSKVKKVGKKEFRYNYTHCELEYLWEGEVIDSIGLSKNEWKSNQRYCLEDYARQLGEMVQSAIDLSEWVD